MEMFAKVTRQSPFCPAARPLQSNKLQLSKDAENRALHVSGQLGCRSEMWICDPIV